MRQIVMSLFIATSIAMTAHADIYKCPDGKGGFAYQDMPCTGAGTQLSIPTGPTTDYVPPVRHERQPAAPSSAEESSPRPAAGESPTATTVSTTQLSLIKLGMSMSEVESKLGKPGSVTQTGNAFVAREQWVYPGTGGVKPAVITFESGRVAYKGREGSEYKRDVGDFIHRR